MMDILYIVGTGSTWENNELRYSLRSIEKNGVNVGRVYLVGFRPDFVSDRVRYIPCSDPYKQKHKNILYKTLYAIEHSDIDNHFLASSDDHFYIRPTDFAELPVYYREEEIPYNRDWTAKDNYQKSLFETRKLLLQYGFPIYQTNPHCNTHFDRDVYNRYRPMFDRCFKLQHGGEMNCVMGNLLIHEGARPEKFHDAKLSGKITQDRWEQRIGDANCISSCPNINQAYMANWLAREFKDKSIYEK